MSTVPKPTSLAPLRLTAEPARRRWNRRECRLRRSGPADASAPQARWVPVGFANCSSTERPLTPVAVHMDGNTIVVNINITAHHVVALDKNVAAARGPNAV